MSDVPDNTLPWNEEPIVAPPPTEYFAVECPECGVGWKLVPDTQPEPAPCPACSSRLAQADPA